MSAPREARVRVVAGVIEVEGRVLVARRGPGQDGAGRWEFPGGKVEPGEADAAALARELREELRIGVEVAQRLAEVRHPHRGGLIHLVFYAVTCRVGHPVAVEHAELGWAWPAELDALLWMPADVPALPAIHAWLAAGAPRAAPDAGPA
jgi:8-oxo-dGTP diphosphatase